MKHPDAVCDRCGGKGFKKGGRDARAWSHQKSNHPLTRVHLYRFEHEHKKWVFRICTRCIFDLDLIGRRKDELAQVAMSRGGVGGELGSPTRGTRTKYDHDLAVQKMEAGG